MWAEFIIIIVISKWTQQDKCRNTAGDVDTGLVNVNISSIGVIIETSKVKYKVS